MDRAASFVGDRRAQGGAMGVAGAALAASGAASLIRKEGGGRKAAQIFLVGVVIAIFGVFGLIGGISLAFNGPADINVTGTVTKIKSNFFGNKCIPTVEFQAQGQTHTVRPDDFAACTWDVGDSTAVRYTAASGGTVAELGTASTTDLIPGSIVLIFAGIIVSVWALILLAIRAGSIVGGAYLIRQGFRRAKSHPDVSPESAVD